MLLSPGRAAGETVMTVGGGDTGNTETRPGGSESGREKEIVSIGTNRASAGSWEELVSAQAQQEGQGPSGSRASPQASAPEVRDLRLALFSTM